METINRKATMLFSPGHGGSVPRLVLFCILALTALPGFVLASTPNEAIRLYNQACEASLAGQEETALEYFRQAVQAGFDDFRYAMADSELTGLAENTVFTDMLTNHLSRLILLSSEKSLELKNGAWTSWIPLKTRIPQDHDAAALRLKWEPMSLDFEVKLEGEPAIHLTEESLLPWLGGPAIMFVLAVPDDTSPFESTNTHPVVFGKKDKSGVGALLLNNQLGWQPVGELTPDISLLDKGRTAVISGSIPWRTIHPGHPLVDNPLGLNVGIFNSKNPADPYVLFPDPHLFSTGPEIHRFVPMDFDLASVREETLMGRLSHSIISADPLGIDVMIISSQSGEARLKTDFLDFQGQSVLPDGANFGSFDLVPGVNRISLTADFSDLRRGSYLVAVEVELPSGATLNWSSNALNLNADWVKDFQQRIDALKVMDQPTALFHLSTIMQAVQSFPKRNDPGSLATSLRHLDSLVTAGETTGSILPDSGAFLLSQAHANGKNILCSIYLPDQYRAAANLEPVVLWGPTNKLKERMIGRLARIYENSGSLNSSVPSQETGFPIYLIPHQATQSHDSLAAEVATLGSCLDWIREYFSGDDVALAGLDSGGGAVLQLAREHPEGLSRLLVFAGAGLAPWPGTDAKTLEKDLASIPAGHPPITWIDFYKETRASGQGKLLLSILRNNGYDLERVTRVPGGLNWAQAADRLVLWAKKLEKF